MSKKITPLILVTGFLGAGKTTFLRHLLIQARQRGQNVGVIINEFGSVDVDGTLLRDTAQSLAMVAGGCACCAGQDDFIGAILEMTDAAATFDFLVIEASGLADPVVLLETLAAPELRARADVSQIICVADASNWNATAGALGPLLRRQLALADTIILNKIDRVDENALFALQQKLGVLAPNARVELAVEGAIQTSNANDSLWNFNGSRVRTVETAAAPHADSHTCWIALPHPIERAALEAQLEKLGEEIWRVKGFVRLRGHSDLQLVQLTGGDAGSRHRIAPFAAPFGAPEPALGLVFIGAHLDEAKLERTFGGLGLSF